MEENTQDTQQVETGNPFTTPAVESFDSQVEQRFGGQTNEGSEVGNSTVKDAFTTQTEQQEAQAPQEGQSQQPQEIPEQGQPLDAKNDERRYQYWQSQAAKRENELVELRKQVDDTQQVQAPEEQA